MENEQKHTPGLLQVGNFDATRIYDSHPDGPIMVASVARKGILEAEREANAERLVACWNACEPFEDPAEAIRLLGIEAAKAAAINALRAENERLRDALRTIEARIHGEYDNPLLLAYGPLSGLSVDCGNIARAALAN